jgi:hypothetical protein
VLLKSLYIMHWGLCLYRKLPTYFSDEAYFFPLSPNVPQF